MCVVFSSPVQYLKERFQLNIPHRFKKAGFMSTGFCDLCGQIIILGQGRKCSAPGTYIHTYIYWYAVGLSSILCIHMYIAMLAYCWIIKCPLYICTYTYICWHAIRLSSFHCTNVYTYIRIQWNLSIKDTLGP